VAQVSIYLIRHGETALNAAGVLRGQLDVPLDEAGRAEAIALGDTFGQIRLTTVVSSPLKRALDTAGPVASATGAAVLVDERLSDRFYGELAGQSLAKAEERFGSIDAAPLVEAWQLLESRAEEAFYDAARAGALAGRPVALVTHDAVLRALLGLLVPCLGAIKLDLPTGSWSKLVGDSPTGPFTAHEIGQLPAGGERP
jgi:broad specificity phosphatase PhoE